MLTTSVFSQTALAITGNSFFRANSFGVENHGFDIRVEIGGNWDTYGPFYTGSCGSESYSGTIYLDPNTNNLRILGISTNDASDYIDGVSAADMTAISNHIEQIELITDGYRLVAADPDGDETIGPNDLTQIQYLILGRSNNFTRKSWNWFNAYDISQITTFDASPWSHVIFSPGLTFSGVSYSDVQNNISRYFNYRCTKIGEVKKTNQNSWVCGTYSVSHKDILLSREASIPNNLKKGILFDLEVKALSSTNDCRAFQIPIYIDPTLFTIKKVTLNGNLPIEYNYREDLSKLVALMWDYNGKNYVLQLNDQLIKITLETKKEINNLDYNSFIHQNINIEFVDSKAELIPFDVEFRIDNLSSQTLQAYIYQGVKQRAIHIWNTALSPLRIEIFDLNGKQVFSKYTISSLEHEIIDLDIDKPGMYLINVISNGRILNLKFSNY